MKILITGNRGFVGKYVESVFVNNGHEIVGFDLCDGNDIKNESDLLRKAKSCNQIIHPAAIESNDSHQTMETNLLCTWNVLEVCKKAGIKKLIYMSSVDALGIFQGESKPIYFPIDDQYPCHPNKPYSISKKLSEEMCLYFSKSTSIPVICFRAPGIWNEKTYDDIVQKRRGRPEYEWDPYWEYGAFLDVCDLAKAILFASEKMITGFECLLIASDDITTSGMTSMELIHKVHPGIKWMGGKEYEKEVYRSLINCDRVENILGWKPEYSWNK
jgi:UDP-glucose 4-epimerase